MDWLGGLSRLLGLLGLLSRRLGRLEGLEDVGSDDLGGGLLLAEPLNHVLHNGEVGLVALQLGHEVGDEGVFQQFLRGGTVLWVLHQTARHKVHKLVRPFLLVAKTRRWTVRNEEDRLDRKQQTTSTRMGCIVE